MTDYKTIADKHAQEIDRAKSDIVAMFDNVDDRATALAILLRVEMNARAQLAAEQASSALSSYKWTERDVPKG